MFWNKNLLDITDKNHTYVYFTIPDQPVGQGRVRISRAGNFVRAYDPPKSRQYKALAWQKARQVYEGKKPLEGPIAVYVVQYFYIPKSYSKKRKRKIIAQKEYHTHKPDDDNVYKAVTDAISGLIYSDDRQVVQHSCFQWYSKRPRVEVLVTDNVLNFENFADSGLYDWAITEDDYEPEG